MSLGRTLAVGVLAVLLTTTLVTATAVAAAHTTVLDPDFVDEAIEAEGGYELVGDAAASSIGGGSAADAQSPVDTDAVVEAAVTDEYVESQTEANVDRAYEYLHANRDDLNLSVSTAPLEDNVSAAVEREVRNASLVRLLERSGASFEGPVDAALVADLTANESSYESTRTEFRDDIRERALDRAVDRAVRNRSNDELLALVIDDYDPREYSEDEKERMISERETEIRAAVRERVESERGDRIDAAVEDRLAEVRAEYATDATNATGTSPTQRAAAEVQSVVVRGLTGDASYQAFRSDLDAAKADLATATGDRVSDRLDEQVPDRVSLVQTTDGEAPPAFQQARTGVTWLDRLVFVVPAVAVALVGLLYVVTRSIERVASTVGWSLVWAGLPTFVGVQAARPRLDSLFARAGAPEGPATDLLVGLLGRVLAVTADVALVTTVGGAVVVAVVLAHRHGLVGRLQATLAARGIEF